MHRKIFRPVGWAVVLVCLLCPAAFAGDGGAEYDWSGPHAGVHAGGNWVMTTLTDVDGFSSNPPGEQIYYDEIGLSIGFLAGYDWQFDDYVLGVEADCAWGELYAATDRTDTKSYDEVAKTEFDWISTLRGRAGYLVDNSVLLYVTGGLAVARVSNKNIDYDGNPPVPDPGDSFDLDTIAYGWVAGAGADWRLSDDWAVRMEGQYLYFDGATSRTQASRAEFKTQDRLLNVRAALVYRFGG